MELASVTPRQLDDLERELISFVYEDSWGQNWRGENLPKDLFRSFAANARRISDGFTEGRRELDLRYLRSKEERSAYLLYFHLASTTRILAVFEEIARRGLWPLRPIRVLDLGSGPGPALWAVRLAQARFGGSISEAVALDGEKAILPVARNLWERLAKRISLPPVSLRTVRADFRDHRTKGTLERLGRFDLILCSNALNELKYTLGDGRRLETFRQILSGNLGSEGMLVILEPALQKTSRELTAFRDQLMAKNAVSTPLPCGHGGGCPLNEQPRDWCNFEVTWSPPPVRKRIEKALEHQSGILRYSYLVLRNGVPEKTADVYRVISDLLDVKGGKLLLLCSSWGRVAIRLAKSSGRFSVVLDSCRRGDLLKMEGVPNGAREVEEASLTSVSKL